MALGVQIADLLPTTQHLDDLDVTRKQAMKLFDELLRSDDRAAMLVLTQVLARLAEAAKG